MQTNYKLPLKLGRILEAKGESLDTCGELESIDQHIELILSTAPGRHRFDTAFGCKIWELDFQNISPEEEWAKIFRQHVQESITRNECRLEDLEVEVKLHDEVSESKLSRAVQVRKRVDIYVFGTLVSNGDRLKLRYTLFLGPLANE